MDPIWYRRAIVRFRLELVSLTVNFLRHFMTLLTLKQYSNNLKVSCCVCEDTIVRRRLRNGMKLNFRLVSSSGKVRPIRSIKLTDHLHTRIYELRLSTSNKTELNFWNTRYYFSIRK